MRVWPRNRHWRLSNSTLNACAGEAGRRSSSGQSSCAVRGCDRDEPRGRGDLTASFEQADRGADLVGTERLERMTWERRRMTAWW